MAGEMKYLPLRLGGGEGCRLVGPIGESVLLVDNDGLGFRRNDGDGGGFNLGDGGGFNLVDADGEGFGRGDGVSEALT